MARRSNKRLSLTVDEALEKVDKKLKEIEEGKKYMEKLAKDGSLDFDIVFQVQYLGAKTINARYSLNATATPVTTSGNWICIKPMFKSAAKITDEQARQMELEINLPRFKSGEAQSFSVDEKVQAKCVDFFIQASLAAYDKLKKDGLEIKQDILDGVEEEKMRAERERQTEEEIDDFEIHMVAQLMAENAEFDRTHFMVNDSKLIDRAIYIHEKTDDLMQSGREQIVTELINVFNSQYDGDVDEKVLDVIDRILDFCEIQTIKKRVGHTTEAVIDSLEKVRIIENLLKETSLIEQDIISKNIARQIWYGVTNKDVALKKLRDMKLTKEDILLDKVLNSRSEGILVQNSNRTKNFTKTADNMEYIIADLKKLYPGKEEVAVLEILKTAATTVLEINNNTIDRTVEFLTDLFDSEVLKSSEIQDFIKRNSELFKDLKLYDRNGNYALYSTDKAIEKQLSLQFAKLLIREKPSQMLSYVDGRSTINLKSDVINNYGKNSLSKYAVLLLEEDSSIMGLDLEACREREDKICAALDKLHASGLGALKNTQHLNSIKTSLKNVTILRAENNRNMCVNKKQSLFGKFGKRMTAEKAYEQNLQTLLENYGPSTVEQILSTNLAILDLKPAFLKAIMNKAPDFKTKAKFARSVNSVMMSLAGRSPAITKVNPSGFERRSIKRANIKNVIEVIGIKPYEIDEEELDEEETQILGKLFDNIISSADLADDKLVVGGAAGYGFDNPNEYVDYIKQNVLLNKFSPDTLDKLASFIPEKERPNFYLFSLFLDFDAFAKESNTTSDLDLTRKMIAFAEDTGFIEKLSCFHDCIGTSYETFFNTHSKELKKSLKNGLEQTVKASQDEKLGIAELNDLAQVQETFAMLIEQDPFLSGKEALDKIYSLGGQAIENLFDDVERERDLKDIEQMLLEVREKFGYRGIRSPGDDLLPKMMQVVKGNFDRTDISKEEMTQFTNFATTLRDSEIELKSEK